MDYPSNRFRPSTSRGATRLYRWFTPVITIATLVALVSVVYFLTDGFGLLSHVNTQRELSELWHSGDYEQVVVRANQLLSQTPMQATPLVFAGFSHFYRGMQQIDEDQRQRDLDGSIRMLRKALLIPQPPLEAEVHYVLAKAYFHLGEFYYDATVYHMNRAIELGFEGQDSYEYLALAYDGLNMIAESVESYQKALAMEPSDLLYAGLADTYMRHQRFAEASRYFQKAIDVSEDGYLIQRARYNLGRAYVEIGQYEAAGEQLRTVLENDPRSADAHYYLGRAYLLSGDAERARFQWREAVRIDPRHEQALASLRSN